MCVMSVSAFLSKVPASMDDKQRTHASELCPSLQLSLKLWFDLQLSLQACCSMLFELLSRVCSALVGTMAIVCPTEPVDCMTSAAGF